MEIYTVLSASESEPFDTHLRLLELLSGPQSPAVRDVTRLRLLRKAVCDS